MNSNVECVACKQITNVSERLKCCSCKAIYHYLCLNIKSEDFIRDGHKYDIAWQCFECVNNASRRKRGDDTPTRSVYCITPNLNTKNTSNETIQSNLSKQSENGNGQSAVKLTVKTCEVNYANENITVRRKEIVNYNVSTYNSFGSLSSYEDDQTSCLLIEKDRKSLVAGMRNESGTPFSIIQEKLASVEAELKNKNKENIELKKKLKSCEKEIEKLTISSNLFTNTEILSDSIKTSPQHNLKDSFKNISNFSSTPKCQVSKHRFMIKKTNDKMLEMSRKITELQEQLNSTQKELNSLLFELNKLNISENVEKTIANKFVTKEKKNQLYILSTNKYNKLLTVAEKTFTEFDICHYLMPNCGISQLLHNIKSKIASFTMEDYCVIMIGEEDFRTTEKYFNILKKIRETLQLVTNTNVLICSPIYRCGLFNDMYNWRVEHFNKLLYKDIKKHKYAYLIDSNINLEYYDDTVFRNRSGIINDNGLSTVFASVHKKICEIQSWYYNSINTIEQQFEDAAPEPLFFR